MAVTQTQKQPLLVQQGLLFARKSLGWGFWR